MDTRQTARPGETPIGYESHDWNPRAFGALLNGRRNQAGFTQMDLANAIGFSPAAIAKWEEGRLTKPPSRGTVLAIEDALGVTDGSLLMACMWLPRLEKGRKWMTDPGNLEAPIIHGP